MEKFWETITVADLGFPKRRERQPQRWRCQAVSTAFHGRPTTRLRIDVWATIDRSKGRGLPSEQVWTGLGVSIGGGRVLPGLGWSRSMCGHMGDNIHDICEQTDINTHLTENITFPQLRLRMVNMTKSFPKAAWKWKKFSRECTRSPGAPLDPRM